MHLLKIVMFIAPAAYACSDIAYRCKNDAVDTDTSVETTTTVCEKSGGELCYCNRFEDNDVCDMLASSVDYFKEKCEAYGSGWYWEQC